MNNIGIIGVGKLGVCLALTLENVGYNVLCYDINESILDSIKNKSLVSYEPKVTQMLLNSKNINVTNNLEDILKLNTVFILVATPSKKDGSYDHFAIDSLIDNILKLSSVQTKHLVIVSTVMPKYTDYVQEKLNNLNINVSYNPEFIAQGSIIHDTTYPDMILIGERDKDSGDIIENIYMKIIRNTPTICRMTPLEAEITKISLNCFLTTKIAFANSVGDLALSQNCNPSNILNAIGSDSRIGKKYLKYGFGFGGPCLPRDNRAYNFFADITNCKNIIGESVDKANTIHSDYVFNYIKNILEKTNKSALFTQVSFKVNSSLLVESQQLQLALKLSDCGVNVYVNETDYIKEQVNLEYKDNKLIFINNVNNINNYIDIIKFLQ